MDVWVNQLDLKHCSGVDFKFWVIFLHTVCADTMTEFGICVLLDVDIDLVLVFALRTLTVNSLSVIPMG